MEEKRKKSPLELLAESGVEKERFSENTDRIPEIQDVTKRKALFFTLLFTMIFLAAIFSVFLFSGSRKEKDNSPESLKISDFSEFARGRLSGNIKSAMNIPKIKGNIVPPEKNGGKVAEIAKKSGGSSKHRNKNEEKDREILENYAKLSDAAAYSPASAGRKRRFVPGGNGKSGGVFLKNGEKHRNGDKIFKLHDIKIKVKLDFSIRSTAQSTVVATVVEEIEEIPKGAKFYGTAKSFINKRTQLAFSKLIIGGEEFSVKGFAVSGKDPGIESEVTDISGENVKSEVKQGMTKTVGAVITGLAGSVGSTAGIAAGNTVNPAASELEKQEETNKMRQEYRVPAGTAFFVYLE
ncbi:hypothetical protein J6Z19_08765 [bacterium]|nr:hypothetical protein [bacterium]